MGIPFSTPDQLLDLKRTGDWGQVKSCKDKECIFFSIDRLAVLYARINKVPIFYIAGQV